MKKIYALLCAALLFQSTTRSQNVILSEDFEGDLANIIVAIPNGSDMTWIDADFDQIPDASGAGRPGEWFSTLGFANVDSSDVVLASNSWTYSPVPVANYLILPPIHLNDQSGMLYWKSAPFQTPRYLDGLQVLVSTSGNFDVDFSDTLKLYAEYISGDAQSNDSSFSNFTFSKGFVFGEDGQYIEYNGDSIRFKGILRPDSATLAAYAGLDIYIAFCHGTTDDNLMSIDDIVVTGNGNFVGVNTPEFEKNALNVFPNPANNTFTVSYSLPSTMQVQLDVTDAAGKVLKTVSHGTQVKGSYQFHVSIADLAAGNYNVVLKTAGGTNTIKVVKQ